MKLTTKLKQIRNIGILKVFFYNSFVSIIKLFFSLITNKLIAIYLGPSGLSVLGQFSNFVGFTSFFARLGIGNGVTSTIAHANTQELKMDVIKTSFSMTFFSSILISTLIILFSGLIIEILFSHSYFYSILIIYSFSLFFYTINAISYASLNGLKQYKFNMRLNLLTSVFGLLTTATLVIFWKIYGAIVSIIITEIITSIFALFFLKKNIKFNFKRILKSIFSYIWLNIINKKELIMRLLKYSVMSFVALFSDTGCQLIMRTYLINEISYFDAGLWQALINISDSYLNIITVTLSLYYLPKLAEITDKYLIRNEIFNSLKIILFIVVIIDLLIITIKDTLIVVLFSNDFSSIGDLIYFQLVGDLFRIISWMLTYILIAKAFTAKYIIAEIFSVLVYLMISFVLIKSLGLKGITLAYIFRYLFSLILLLFFTRDYLPQIPLKLFK